MPTPSPETTWAYYTLAGLLSLVVLTIIVGRERAAQLEQLARRARGVHVFSHSPSNHITAGW